MNARFLFWPASFVTKVTRDAEFTNVAMADFLAGLAKNVQDRDATLTQYHRIVTVPPTRSRPPTPRPS
jgi:hypothetical protein